MKNTLKKGKICLKYLLYRVIVYNIIYI